MISDDFDKKGFTLVKLIKVMIPLALIIGVFIIIVVENSQKKDYELLIYNINEAAENFYIECQYDGIYNECSKIKTEGIFLEVLVKYGFLDGDRKTYTLLNPLTKENISNCLIKIEYKDVDVRISLLKQNETASCPDSY